jgi:7-cyano-7-deazaguanine synthase in queuosine biosynthesis
MSEIEPKTGLPLVRVAVLEPGQRAPAKWTPCVIGAQKNLVFSTAQLESYCLSTWKPVIFDALLVAAAVEFCDRIQIRPALGWGRAIEIRIPVHELERWKRRDVHESLVDALNFLTGDRWTIIFVAREKPEAPPQQGQFEIPPSIQAVIPFSDGIDSSAVAGLMESELGNGLIRVRLGSKTIDQARARGRKPFTSVPYRVRTNKSNGETSARSRGFKFATVSGVAAFLIGAREIIIPESGQGALGSALVPVGHAYEDYRNHPLFTDRMEKYLDALFGRAIAFRFPRLWNTKGETLAAYTAIAKDESALDAWSCWQQSRQVSVDGEKRQCGICAACMLRRLSVHAANLAEPRDTYVWENLGARSFEEGAARGFDRVTTALWEYAIAGTLHLDHLASLYGSPIHAVSVRRAAFQLSKSQHLPSKEAESRLNRLLAQHQKEWRAFLASLGSRSFIRHWISEPHALAS